MQILAAQATDEYQQFEQNRKNALDNARRRAEAVLRTHFIQKKEDRIQANIENVHISLLRASGSRNCTVSWKKSLNTS